MKLLQRTAALLVPTPERLQHDRNIAQDRKIPVEEEEDCGRARAASPVEADLVRKGEEVVVVENSYRGVVERKKRWQSQILCVMRQDWKEGDGGRTERDE